MSSVLGELTRREYGSVADVMEGLDALEKAMCASRDRRAVFATAYLNVTKVVDARIRQAAYYNNEWVGHYLIAFANLYRHALYCFEADLVTDVPHPWRLALRLSRAGRVLTIQDLILGINAHIYHDMPLALLQVGIDPDREHKRADHFAINDALWVAIGPIQERISSLYAPGLGWLDSAFGPFDEVLAQLGFITARQRSWNLAVRLAEADSPELRAARCHYLERQAALHAKRIVGTVSTRSWQFNMLRRVERCLFWSTTVGFAPHHHLHATMEPERNPMLASMDDLIQQLKELTARLDTSRSRLAAFASAYVLISEKIQEKLNEVDYFEDRGWIEQVAVQFGTRYLDALALFESGAIEQLPDSWRIAFDASTEGETIIPQVLALHMNARLNYDLAIALERAGVGDMPDTTAQRERDFKRIFKIFHEGIDEVQALVARKYSTFLTVLDVLAGPLDEAAVSFAYREARDSAWENALRLTSCATAEEREAVLEPMDQEAAKIAQRLLLQQVSGSGMLLRTLRKLERRYEGPWSDMASASSTESQAS